ncbi:hypothetical protein EBO15_29210 [Actinomadura harenae]|uniref:Beta/gamma crystallin 'Greek key' domain-containing protein n=2 Tax=Actinomadura harenae TaxID=2483351 RepID=A0A3M2LRE4_9ACTN|nr:hypothetical protein EBO15_29210 [Actinomadura harenae]
MKVLTGALALGCAAGVALGTATAASASVGDFTYRSGQKDFRLHNEADGPCHSLAEMGSRFKNLTGTTVELFSDKDCHGRHAYMEPHAGAAGAPEWAWSFRFLP